MPRIPWIVLLSVGGWVACAAGKDDGDTDVPTDTDDGGDTDEAPPDTDLDDTDPGEDTDVDEGPGQLVIPVVTCPGTAPTSVDRCDVVAGNAIVKLVGTVLAPDTTYEGGAVVVDEDGLITCVGCDCDAPSATVVTCGDAVISPGLINGHEHLTFAGDVAPDDGERYEDRQQWRRGYDDATEIDVVGSIEADEVRWNELRHLVAGTTSLVGSGGQDGLTRNLDRASDATALGTATVDFESFPLGDSSGQRLLTGCDYGSVKATPNPAADAFLPHVGEGVDAFAAHELDCLTGGDVDASDVIDARTAILAGVAFDGDDLALLADRGAGLFWSPRVNVRLYGNTLPITTARALGLRIGLGTDWFVTGSMNMLRELACAASFDDAYLGDVLSDAELWRMATATGADLTATDTAIGRLSVGLFGDIVVFDASARDAHAAITGALSDDVVLVLRGGKALYGDEDAVLALRGEDVGCDTLEACSRDRALCLLDDIGKDFATLEGGVREIMPALFTCEPPADEPTCVPSRDEAVDGSTVYDGTVSAADDDGDGVPDASDVCPTTFDPVRPMDDEVQADVDGDGLGDVCDPCPVDETCP